MTKRMLGHFSLVWVHIYHIEVVFLHCNYESFW